jgi:PAS domain S-box-containing protein
MSDNGRTFGPTPPYHIVGTGFQAAINRLVQVVADVIDGCLAIAYSITADTRTVCGLHGVDTVSVGAELPLTGSLCGVIAETGLPLIISDTTADPVHAGKVSVPNCGIRAYSGFPVRDDDERVVAILAVAALTPRDWTSQQLRSVGAAAQLLGDILSGSAGTAGPRGPAPQVHDDPGVPRHPESLFEALLEAAPDAIVGVTADGTITLVNVQTERLFGYRREELLGQSVDLLVPGDLRAAHPGHRDRYFALPKSRPMGAGLSLTAVRKDGTEFPAEISLSALRTEGGMIVSAAIRDVTDRLLAQAERERLVAQAERDAAERRMQHTRRLESLGQLAGGVAHDFNNILAVISNYTALVQETLAEPNPGPADLVIVRADLEQVSRAAGRAGRLTKQLLAFGRREITQAEVLDLNEVITEVEQMLCRSLGEHIHLITLLERRLWPVFADASQIEQVVVNLAVNARDAMPGGGTLSIDTGNVELDRDDAAGSSLPAGRYARLRVSDTGAGMTREVMERAFEPFYTTKPRGSGTGLGLATVYGIITSAGGDVQLYSEAGIGTTITILLPATGRVAAGVAAPPAGMPDGAAPSATILLVEDENVLRQVAVRILTRAGYDVLPADGGAQAVHFAKTHPDPIDLLLTDVIMPNMLGNEVAERIRSIRPGIPVLYMSGYASPVLTENGTLQDGVVIVEKPFTSRELLDRIQAVLRDTAASR